MKPSLLRAAILAALLPCLAQAETESRQADTDTTATQTRARRLDAIHVHGLRADPLPGNSAQLEGAALDTLRRQSPDTARLLLGLPGVTVQAAGGLSALPVVHGLAGDRNRVQIDGMDLIASCPNHMNPPLSYIDPDKVGVLRVYAGLSPVSAGGDSIGGSIQVESRLPRFAEAGEGWDHQGRIGLGWASNGDARRTELAVGVADAHFSLGYEGSSARAGNLDAGESFRSDTATGRETHELATDVVASSAYRADTHRLTAALRGESHYLQATLGYQDVPYQYYPNQRMDMLDNRQHSLNLRYAGSFDWGRLEARAWGEQVEHRMDFGPDRQFWYGPASMPPGVSHYSVACAPVGPTCAAGMPMLTESRTRSLSLAATVPTADDGELRLGAEWQGYRLDDWWPPSGGGMWPGSFWNIRDGERDRASLYAEWQASVTPRWEWLAGVRVSQIRTGAGDVAGYATTPGGSYLRTAAEAAAFNASDRERRDEHLDLTLLGRFQASTTVALELGFARKTRSPNLYERYTWSSWPMAAAMNNFVGDGNGYVGDVGLDPETAHTLSASLVWKRADGRANLRITPHISHIDDFIDAVRLTGYGDAAFNVLRYANQDARILGVDVAAEHRFAPTRLGEWRVEAIASTLHGRNRDSGDGLYHVMPDNATLRLVQAKGRWEHRVEWLLVDAKDDGSALRNQIATRGHGRLNLAASYAADRYRVDIGIDNVFDRGYDLPLGGAYVAQGRTMSLNGIPWGIAVPGAGRSIRAHLSYRF